MAVDKMVIIKIIELLIAITCMGLHCKSTMLDMDKNMVSDITFGGYIIILCGALIGKFLDGPFEKKVDIYFSFVGLVLFLTCGALAIDAFNNMFSSDTKNIGLAKGALAIINAIIFIVDLFLTWKQG